MATGINSCRVTRTSHLNYEKVSRQIRDHLEALQVDKKTKIVTSDNFRYSVTMPIHFLMFASANVLHLLKWNSSTVKNKIKYPKRKYHFCKMSGGIDEKETIRLHNKKARQDNETRRREMSMKNDEEKDAAGNSDIDDVHEGTECYSDE